MRKRVLVVGGVAGGASYAARLRRLDETAQIAVFDRGPHVSFANCGLPYLVGTVIADQGELLLASRELFRQRFAIAVCTRHEAVAIDRARRVLRVRDLDAPGGPAEREARDLLRCRPARLLRRALPRAARTPSGEPLGRPCHVPGAARRGNDPPPLTLLRRRTR